MSGLPSPHIITCYGSFVREESQSYNLILEWADRGTLEEFMQKTPKPPVLENAALFWDRLSDILHGLATIHGATTEVNPARQALIGYVGLKLLAGHSAEDLYSWHQDIKPANILVFSGDTHSPYDSYFKIADLGLSHFKAGVASQSDASDFDAYGTRAYGLSPIPLAGIYFTNFVQQVHRKPFVLKHSKSFLYP